MRLGFRGWGFLAGLVLAAVVMIVRALSGIGAAP